MKTLRKDIPLSTRIAYGSDDAACNIVYGMITGESNYMLFGSILKIYDEGNPTGELANFKKMIAGILDCEEDTAIETLNALLQDVVSLRPLRDAGFQESDIKAFPQSVVVNQQRLLRNSYVPMTMELMV